MNGTRGRVAAINRANGKAIEAFASSGQRVASSGPTPRDFAMDGFGIESIARAISLLTEIRKVQENDEGPMLNEVSCPCVRRLDGRHWQRESWRRVVRDRPDDDQGDRCKRQVTAEKGKWLKEDIKKAKISVEGADVDITKVVLHWNNAKDDTITGIGVVKWGGFTAEKDAPGHEATLMSVAVEYKILNNATSATIKVWGYD